MTTWTTLKRRVIGQPIATEDEGAHLLPKRLALPVFASDPLSSVAYASEEAMLVLAIAGAGALRLLTPVSLAVAALLAIVVMSYRQTIRAYPGGGGAFIVAHENLGVASGVVAAAALLTDYVLTVAVSVAAGVAAITSAYPALLRWRVEMALGFVVLLTLTNLRGIRESSRLFALPTYAFLVTVSTMLIAGFLECADGECPKAVSSGIELEPGLAGVSMLLVLRAFASGSTALTGVEAIADGVQAFQEPKSRNAATTLGAMGLISITMFLGISTLARLFDVRISEGVVDQYGTVISQIGRAVFNGGIGFWILQVATAGILVLAANTAYQDFPRLSSILSRYGFMPRQFRNRGDRLVFSNGVFALAVLAGALIVVFDAQVSKLIQLYVVGVFTSFTLSQTGMVRRWLRTREPGWRRSVVINAIGAVTTGVVLVVVAAVKFSHGAWIVIVAVPLLVAWMMKIKRHYLRVAAGLSRLPYGGGPTRPHRVILLAAHTDSATERALRYAALIDPESITVVHAVEPDESEDLVHIWSRLYPQHPLVLLEPDRDPVVRRIRRFIRTEREAHPDARITVVLAERFRSRNLRSVFSHPHSLVLKALLLFEPGVAVTDLTFVKAQRTPLLQQPPISRHVVVLTVSEVTQPTLEALQYAKQLHPDGLHCVHIDVDDSQRERVEAAWHRDGLEPELEVVKSPYRGITRPLVRYVRRRRHDEPSGTLVNVMLPEFIVPGRLGQFLHNQTGLAIKGAFAAEPNVAVTSVPFHLARADQDREPAQVQ